MPNGQHHIMRPFISRHCVGERCYCGRAAKHKVEEVIFDDEPDVGRHPLTRYVCHKHFKRIMGPAAKRCHDGVR